MKKTNNIDEYIASFPKDVQILLEQMRAAVHKAAPEAEEVISYGMPAFKYKGLLVWFAAHSKHIGFYPRVSAIQAFQKQLSSYKSAKGSVQFAFDKPLPIKLIAQITLFRVKENTQREKVKNNLK